MGLYSRMCPDTLFTDKTFVQNIITFYFTQVGLTPPNTNSVSCFLRVLVIAFRHYVAPLTKNLSPDAVFVLLAICMCKPTNRILRLE